MYFNCYVVPGAFRGFEYDFSKAAPRCTRKSGAVPRQGAASHSKVSRLPPVAAPLTRKKGLGVDGISLG